MKCFSSTSRVFILRVWKVSQIWIKVHLQISALDPIDLVDPISLLFVITSWTAWQSDRDGHLIQRCPGDLRLSINCKMWEFRPQHDKLHHYHLFILLATVTRHINSIINLTRQINTKMKFWRIQIAPLLLHSIIQRRSSDGNPAQSPSFLKPHQCTNEKGPEHLHHARPYNVRN